jgi:hypothetical protein
MTHLSDEQLLASADGELEPRDAAAVSDHVARCRACAERLQRFGQVSNDLKAAYERRTRLGQTLVVLIGSAICGALWLGWSDASFFSHVSPEDMNATTLPLRYLTPGAVVAVSATDVCSLPHKRREIAVPVALRHQVLRNYGVRNVSDREYELDYLITPELGGATDARNLWPERYALPVWNAQVKDELEELLHRLVCNGSLPLSQAQNDMAGNWIAAYKRYFHTNRPGDLPGGLRPPLPTLE